MFGAELEWLENLVVEAFPVEELDLALNAEVHLKISGSECLLDRMVQFVKINGSAGTELPDGVACRRSTEPISDGLTANEGSRVQHAEQEH